MKKYIIAKWNSFQFGIFEIVTQTNDEMYYQAVGDVRVFESKLPKKLNIPVLFNIKLLGSHCRIIEIYPEQITLEYLQNLYKTK